VRSLSNESKVAHLRDLCPSSKHKIELVEADLNSSAGYIVYLSPVIKVEI
jgi:hypothetical protein